VFLLNVGWLLVDYVALQPDGSVGTATGYGLGDRGSILGSDGRFFIFSTASTLVLGLTQVPGALSSGEKWPMCEADHSRPSSAEVKNDGAIPPFPHTSSWRDA
jgi:hypothetical protein